MNKAFITTRLFGRVKKWDNGSKIELDAFQESVRKFGFDAIFGHPWCSEEKYIRMQDGSIRIEFWLRVKGQYQHFSLEAKEPEVFVLDI